MSADELEDELNPKRILEGELVPHPKSGKLSKKTGSYPLTPAQIRKRDRVYTDVTVLKDRKFVTGRFSDRERKAIAVLLKTGNVKKAAEEIGVTPQTIYNYARRPFVRAYLEQMRSRAAGAADLTVEKLVHKMNAAVEGIEELSPSQIAAAKIAAQLVAPRVGSGTNITVNQQNNFNGVSPFKDLDQKSMLAELQQNLLEMGAGEAASVDAA